MATQFLDNKYTYWYWLLIVRAYNQNRTKLDRDDPNYVYYERHHIIPRSLGGDDSKTNLVLLNAREHFVAHLLLARMTTGHKRTCMLRALHGMAVRAGRPNARNYAFARYNLKHTEEHKQKISQSRRGKKHSPEVREKIAAANRVRTQSPEYRAKARARSRAYFADPANRERHRRATQHGIATIRNKRSDK